MGKRDYRRGLEVEPRYPQAGRLFDRRGILLGAAAISLAACEDPIPVRAPPVVTSGVAAPAPAESYLAEAHRLMAAGQWREASEKLRAAAARDREAAILLETCRIEIDAEEKLAKARRFLAEGRRDEASSLLRGIDERASISRKAKAMLEEVQAKPDASVPAKAD